MYLFTIDEDTRVFLCCARESAKFREWLKSKEVYFTCENANKAPFRLDEERARVSCVLQQYFEETDHVKTLPQG